MCRHSHYRIGVLFEVTVIGAAVVLVLITLGSIRQLVCLRFHAWILFLGALALQITLGVITLPDHRIETVGFGLVMASYTLLLAFSFSNRQIRGMGVVTVGIAMNALVIGLNQGMPTKDPGRIDANGKTVSAITADATRRPQRDSDLLVALGDTIVLNGPYDQIISFGDLIIAVGLCDIAFWGSRRTKKPRRRTQRREPEVSTAPQPVMQRKLQHPPNPARPTQARPAQQPQPARAPQRRPPRRVPAGPNGAENPRLRGPAPQPRQPRQPQPRQPQPRQAESLKAQESGASPIPPMVTQPPPVFRPSQSRAASMSSPPGSKAQPPWSKASSNPARSD